MDTHLVTSALLNEIYLMIVYMVCGIEKVISFALYYKHVSKIGDLFFRGMTVCKFRG